ncbi:MAG: chromosomal replication initiator protein DnaA [Clostridiales bacterium]|jgi:chromosomal replication initiator protein|nr:chromosomal replication initiator protein DnaA [Clostridiales bacterium]
MDSQIEYYWVEVCKLLEKELTEIAMDIFIKTLKPLYFNDDFFVFEASETAHKNTVEQRYIGIITTYLRAVTEKNLDIKLVLPEHITESAKSEKSNHHFMAGNIKQKYVFETFVRGKSNELAYAACVAVSGAPGKTSYNPLFLYGGVGLGKTHLMHSMGNKILSVDPNYKVLYCSSETFTNELINSIKERRNQEFRNKYRDIDVLLIDDIQFLSEKEGTQEEFFHTFNTLYDANKQIVISSDQPPKDLKTLEDRLRSRFGCGLIVDITFPDYETRVAILEKKAELDHTRIPKEVTNFIAKNIVSNIRELEGALNKVIAFATLCNNPITIELAENALRDIISAQTKPEITPEFIQNVVSNYYNITTEDIRSKKRNANISYPRQIAMYLTRKILDMSLPKVGDCFGGRDHSTVIHACDKITFEMENDKNVYNVLLELEKKIKGD